MNALLSQIIENIETHKRWINTLSYLEHIGSRKIIKSQNSRKLDLNILQHISEEARHAFFLKNIGHTYFQDFCPTFEASYLLGGSAADTYFQSLDEFITEALVDHSPSHIKVQNNGNLSQTPPLQNPLCYFYVTFIVEIRALNIYTLYSELLTESHFKFKLTPLITEEETHLEETHEWIQKNDSLSEHRISQFTDKEAQLFEDFKRAIEFDIHRR